MLMIRLQRVGRKNDPSFRLVATEKQNGPQSGKFLEVLGSYDARQGAPVFKTERIKHWLGVGAQPSQTVHNLLVKAKIIEGVTHDARSKKVGKRLAASKAATAKAGQEKAEPAAEEVAEAPAEDLTKTAA